MEHEMLSLSDVVMAAVSEYYGNSDNPGMVTSFMMVAEIMRENGDGTAAVAFPDTQSYTQTLGLIGFGEEWIRDDIRTSFLQNGDV